MCAKTYSLLIQFKKLYIPDGRFLKAKPGIVAIVILVISAPQSHRQQFGQGEAIAAVAGEDGSQDEGEQTCEQPNRNTTQHLSHSAHIAIQNHLQTMSFKRGKGRAGAITFNSIKS